MLIDRSHFTWAVVSGISLAAGATSYGVYAGNDPKGPSGGSPMGLLYGVIGTGMMLFAGLLGARKSIRNRRIGSAQFWLRGHLWLGTLCIPFILFHSGFGWGGLLEQWLWYTLVIVACSGFFGLGVQQVLPRALWTRVPLETFEAQTAYQCDRLTFIADVRIARLSGEPLRVPASHLTAHWVSLVRGYFAIAAGPGSQSEKNPGKLNLLQQTLPAEVRDFAWAMARFAKSDAKAIRFEGDFPELLSTTYADLHRLASDAVPPSSNTPAETKSSELLEKSHADVPAKQTLEVVRNPQHSQKPLSSENSGSQAVAPAGIVPKPSPLELMRKKSAGTSGSQESTGSAPPTPVPAATTGAKSPVVPTRTSSGSDLKTNAAPGTSETPAGPTAAEKKLLADFYTQHVRPFLAEIRSGSVVSKSPLASASGAARLFREKEVLLPISLQPVLRDLAESCEIRRQFEVQRTIQRWMHWWLMVHVPVSVALLIFLVAHIVMALRVVPFGS